MRTAAWQARVTNAGGSIAPGIPLRCLQHQMADMISRACVRSLISPFTCAALDADMTARTNAIEGALAEFFNGTAPPDGLLKKLQATITCFRPSKGPDIADVAEQHTSTDAFKFKHKSDGMGFGRAAKVFPACYKAAWPEFDWSDFFALADLVDRCADTNLQSDNQGKRTAALQLAAQTWGEGLKRIEAGANKIRNHGGDDGDAPDVVICGHGFKAWLEEQRKPLNSAISLVGSILAQVVDKTPPAKTAPFGGKGSLNGAMPAWKEAHPNKCLFHFCKDDGCKLDSKCPHAASHAEPKDQQWAADFKAKHNL